ncbi:F420-non-reducing hydrogenase subunit G [Gossypium australe]|uniref:F420-non-reducing hydrogenase subunit G n=1 Tax=Gossypium australe TaxID=47621 RepID=A0A5B6V1B7_9ROSI|nr:F420-non-reducing hydrogenase subunit G [Gossypium australe]
MALVANGYILWFTNALAGLAVNDVIQRTAGRLDSLHSEGVHVLRYFQILFNILIIIFEHDFHFLYLGDLKRLCMSMQRLSEMCCLAMSHLLMLGKSVISGSNKVQDEDADGDMMNIDWPEDSVEKAKLIRLKAQSMTGYVEAVSSSFITGISDVAEAYLAAVKSVNADSHEALTKASIQEKANSFSEHLRSDQNIAVSKIQDGLQNLSYVVLSNSMPAA